MKLHVLSDLHIEGYHFDIKQYQTDSDVLVLVGDIGRIDGEHKETLQQFLIDAKSMYDNVLYVAGNHEMYFSDYFDTLDTLKEISDKAGIQFLQNEEVNIDGINFFGSIFWTDMNSMLAAQETKQYLNDFRLITYDNKTKLITPEFIYNENQKARGYLKLTKANVIITHHLPIWECVDPKWHMSTGNYGFVNTDLVTKGELWLFGHSHSSNDFWKDGTRFVSNQKGYGSENYTKFDPMKVVEI